MPIMRQVLAMTLVVAGIVPPAVSVEFWHKRKARTPFEMFSGFGYVDSCLNVPFTNEGAALIHKTAAWYQPLDSIGFGPGFEWVMSENQTVIPGNLSLKLRSGTGEGIIVGDGFGFIGNVVGLVGFGMPDTGGEGRVAAADIGRATRADWIPFLPDYAVVGAEINIGFFLNNTLFRFNFGPRFAWPWDDNARRPTRYGFRYEGQLRFMLFGDWRGGLWITLGSAGFKEFTGAEEHLFGLTAGVEVFATKTGIHPYLRAWTPVHGEDAGISTSMELGVEWRFDARLPKEDPRDPLPPSPTTALVPMLP